MRYDNTPNTEGSAEMGKAKSVPKAKASKRKAPFVYATKDELAKEYTPDDHKELINAEITIPKNTTRTSYSQISPSYWRITFWGKEDPSKPFSPAHILDSKFIRIDIDSAGRLNYNDVTDGKRL